MSPSTANPIITGFAFIQVPFLSITAMVADHLAKASDVRILGFEPDGSEMVVIRLAGTTGALQAAIEEAEKPPTSPSLSAAMSPP